jgi:hypothetical protein
VAANIKGYLSSPPRYTSHHFATVTQPLSKKTRCISGGHQTPRIKEFLNSKVGRGGEGKLKIHQL